MITYLPLPSFKESAERLDDKTLDNQRFAVLHIMEVFQEVNDAEKSALARHPVIKMWKGYELQLCEYGLEVCDNWKSRGFDDAVYEKIAWHLDNAATEDATFNKPNWWGDVDFHLSHQAELMRKNPTHYGQYFRVDTSLKVIWPVSDRL